MVLVFPRGYSCGRCAVVRVQFSRRVPSHVVPRVEGIRYINMPHFTILEAQLWRCQKECDELRNERDEWRAKAESRAAQITWLTAQITPRPGDDGYVDDDKRLRAALRDALRRWWNGHISEQAYYAEVCALLDPQPAAPAPAESDGAREDPDPTGR